MEQRALNNKYKNIQFYESKYTSTKKQENEFELINEKKYDYVIKKSHNNSKNKDNYNGSRNNENSTKKYSKNSSKTNFYKPLESNKNEKNNYNSEEYNNGGNISNFQNYNDKNNNKFVITSGNNNIKYISSNNSSSQFLKNDPKKFSNVAKVLKYIGNKDNSNVNLIPDNNSRTKYEYKINSNNLKNEKSSEKNNLRNENKSCQNNNIKRSFDIQTNYNKKKISLKNPGKENYRGNKVWSNINKDLVPTKADLKFEINKDENKDITPLKYNQRFYRNNYTENNLEGNNNKINGGGNNIAQFKNEEDKYDTEENNKNFISYKIRIKDVKEFSIQKKEDDLNLKKYKSNNNIKVTYDQGRRSNKNLKVGNISNKNQNSQIQTKIDKIHNFANLKGSTTTRSSPNILINDNSRIAKTPKLTKENSNNNILNPNNGKNTFKNNEEYKITSTRLRNKSSYENSENISKNDKVEENPVKKIYIEKNKYNNLKNENENDNVNDNKINERIKELRQIMSYNKRFNHKNNESYNENGLKVGKNDEENNDIDNKNVEINKNIYFLQQKNEPKKIIFHKKVSKSPTRFDKKFNITNDNIESKENIKPAIKINYRNSRKSNVINDNIKLTTDSLDNNNKIIIKYDSKNTEKFISKTNNNMIQKEIPRNSHIINEASIYNGNGNNAPVYIRQKAIKKISLPNLSTKGKIDNEQNEEIKVSKRSKINSIKRNILKDNHFFDNLDNFPQEAIKEKIILKNKKVIKYYDFFLKLPKIQECRFTNIMFRNIQYPKIEVCQISKMNSVVYVIYKNKNLCYITKTRERIKKITQPPINSVCEYSKNIILNYVKIKNSEINDTDKNKENKVVEDNKQPITTVKKTKKRKKRRKTRRLHKEDTNINEKNNNLTETKKENTDITSKDISKEEIEREINEKNSEDKSPKINTDPNNINNINNINITIKTPEENNIISIPKKLMTNDKSSQEDKSVFSEKEILIDIDKNSNSIRKKLSPTTYNDEEFNEEENDDFRIASDDDDLSDDKFKKKQFDTFDKFENGKTEGKEIIGDYDINKGNLDSEKNKNKFKEGFKLLEKWNDRRNMNDYNENEGEYNDYENIEESDGNNLNIDNIDNMNKNIILGADKLNLIFNSQKNYKFTSEEDNENENDNYNYNYDDVYTDSNANNNYSENENNNYIEDKKKNLTYKNKYEKIGSIFDKLEEIFDKKKEKTNIIDINLDKFKTPITNKDKAYRKNRISDFNLQNEDYMYNDNDDENNEEENSKKRKNTFNKKGINIDKYQEIFNNQQQIISKLELLMNKPKINQGNSNLDNDNKIFNYNSPKIEFETDSDININKDTPGNRKEFRLYKLQSNPKFKYIYSLEEILSYQNKDICKDISLLNNDVLSHCDSIIKTIKEEYTPFKVNYKEIKISNNNYELKTSMDKWARKDMSKEIEKAEKYVKELNIKMSNDNLKYKIIEILNTLTVDNYKNILNNLFTMIFLEENNTKEKNELNNHINLTLNNYTLNKPEYLLHNQFIFIEIILEKATKEKGYVVLYAKLCADLFIEFIKYIKDIKNPEIENQLINGENLKTILTSECKQKFDECISMDTLYKNKDNEDKKEIFLIFKKKFLGNMDFIAELINVKLLSQTKGFEFLDILYKRYCEIQNEQIKYLNLEGAIILLTKFGKIVFDRKNPKHLQNLDNYMKDNICPIVDKKDNNLPNYLKFKIINLIEKKKNNWKDSLYEQSIIAKGKNNNNISIYHEHDGTNNNINIDESLMDNSNKNFNANNNTNLEIDLEKENNIILLIKNDLENYISYLNENQIFSLKDLLEKDNNDDINNNYDWSMTEELIIKEKNDLDEIIRCFIEVCIDYVQKEQNIFYCDEYIKNIINYYSADLSKEQSDKVRNSMIDLFLNIENICVDNFFMFEIMGYLMLLLLENYLFYTEDLDKFMKEDKNKIPKIMKVIKFMINYYPDDKRKDFLANLENSELFEKNKDLLEG